MLKGKKQEVFTFLCKEGKCKSEFDDQCENCGKEYCKIHFQSHKCGSSPMNEQNTSVSSNKTIEDFYPVQKKLKRHEQSTINDMVFSENEKDSEMTYSSPEDSEDCVSLVDDNDETILAPEDLEIDDVREAVKSSLARVGRDRKRKHDLKQKNAKKHSGKIAERLLQFPNHGFVSRLTPMGSVLFCEYCRKEVNSSDKSVVERHINSNKHVAEKGKS